MHCHFDCGLTKHEHDQHLIGMTWTFPSKVAVLSAATMSLQREAADSIAHLQLSHATTDYNECLYMYTCRLQEWVGCPILTLEWLSAPDGHARADRGLPVLGSVRFFPHMSSC